MKTNFKGIKSHLIEFIIVTAGVLIALLLSNIKENNQARRYYNKSIETINNEIETNYNSLKENIEGHMNLLDTINKYTTNHITISELIVNKGGGLSSTILSNSGLEFYKKNQLNSIDFEIMSELIRIENTTKLINTKMEKLMDFLYPNLFVDSEESKKLVVAQINNLLNSETQLMQQYENFMDRYIVKEKEKEKLHTIE
ncbi:MAG: hypothetical protein PHO94_01925 [Petrimonas sp.]|nr:hypothetical protein [Petrimonas sp.]